MIQAKQPLIVLFDGVCNLCHGSVNFIIDRDPANVFRFASLQSGIGIKLLEDAGQNPEPVNSIVLIDGEKVHRRSSAALRIAWRLRFPWPLLAVFLLVPRPLRDAVYDFIARNRYRWFGQSDACRLPTPDRASRFLTGDERTVA